MRGPAPRLPGHSCNVSDFQPASAETVRLMQDVKQVVQRMMQGGIRPREDTFNTLMTAALENNDAEVVPNLFNQLLSLNLKPDTLSYTALITALSRLNRPEAAVRHLDATEHLCGTSKSPTAWTLCLPCEL